MGPTSKIELSELLVVIICHAKRMYKSDIGDLVFKQNCEDAKGDRPIDKFKVQKMKGIALTVISLLLLGLVPVSVRAADWIMVGDIGCKPAAITNIKNIAATKK